MATHDEAKSIVLKLAVFYGMELDVKMQLPLYAKVLESYPIEQLSEALNRYVANPANERFPIPPQKIMQELTGRPSDDDAIANEVAARIRNAIGKYGCGVYLDDGQRQPFLIRIQLVLGEVGWAVVEREGGWESFCVKNNTGEDARILQAQLRDMAKSVLRQARAGTLGQAPALPLGPTPQLSQTTQPGRSYASQSESVKKLVTHVVKSLPPSDRDDADEESGV